MTQASAAPDSSSASSGPWWKFGHMWLVVGGPLIVVVASFITFYLAVRTPDPVYAEPPRVHQTEEGSDPTLTPAMQARNHAASPESGKLLEGTAPKRQPGHP